MVDRRSRYLASLRLTVFGWWRAPLETLPCTLCWSLFSGLGGLDATWPVLCLYASVCLISGCLLGISDYRVGLFVHVCLVLSSVKKECECLPDLSLVCWERVSLDL